VLVSRAAIGCGALIAFGALIGCGAAISAPTPTPDAPEPAAATPPPAPTSVATAAAGGLPFRMPCASDDAVGCTNACDAGIVEDCTTLGAMYLSGSVVTIDRERAVALFQRACARDSARACMLLGDAYHAGFVPPAAEGAQVRDPHAEEVLMYHRACDGGSNQGCLLAGKALANGHGVARDPKHAAQLLAPVCDRGNAEACLELGKLAQHGEGVKRDPERALELFRKACGLGMPEGCLRANPRGQERSPRAP
jgi:TPR repeat protein